MSTTVKQFKEWLNRFPDETIIEIGFQSNGTNYEAYGPVYFKDIELNDSDNGDGWEFMSFIDNKYIDSESSLFNKSFLKLGESC